SPRTPRHARVPPSDLPCVAFSGTGPRGYCTGSRLRRKREPARTGCAVRPGATLVGAASGASFAPSPAKAGEGWGGVSFGSARTVGTPSQPPPAVAGGGAKAKCSLLKPLLQELRRVPTAYPR